MGIAAVGEDETFSSTRRVSKGCRNDQNEKQESASYRRERRTVYLHLRNLERDLRPVSSGHQLLFRELDHLLRSNSDFQLHDSLPIRLPFLEVKLDGIQPRGDSGFYRGCAAENDGQREEREVQAHLLLVPHLLFGGSQRTAGNHVHELQASETAESQSADAGVLEL